MGAATIGGAALTAWAGDAQNAVTAYLLQQFQLLALRGNCGADCCNR